MFMMILGLFADIIGYAISAMIIVLVGKFMFDIVKTCLSIIWETVHKPSYDKYANKPIKLFKKSKKEEVKQDA